MMIHEFNYTKIRGRTFPIVPITIVTESRVKTLALIDSGASISLFKSTIANKLGISIQDGKSESMGGISGKITVYIHDIMVNFEDDEFICKVGFSEEYSSSFNILGRDNFFKHFLITFDENNEKIKLKNYKKVKN